MKIVINKCYGGFGLSEEAEKLFAAKKNIPVNEVYDRNIDRNDLDLINVIETLGAKQASSGLSELKIVEIPDNVEYTIQEYDGIEWVAEKHDTWS